MMIHKIILCFFSIFFFIFFSCSDTEKEKVLRFGVFAGSNWDVAVKDSAILFDRAIDKFELENPGVKITYNSGIRKDQYSEWLSQQVLDGTVPDVFVILESDFTKLVSLGILEPLDIYISGDASFDIDRYYKLCLNGGRSNGKQYALPFETVPDVMCVNKTLLEKENISVPLDNYSWQDLYDMCRQITKDNDGDGILDQFGICGFGWLEAVYSDKISLFSLDGKECFFNTPEVAAAVKFIQSLENLNQGYKVTQDDFDSGNVAFMPISIAEYRTYKSYPYQIKKYSEFQWDAVDMPKTPGGKNSSVVNSLIIGMSRNSRNKQLAWDFLKTLTYDSKIQQCLFVDSVGISPLKDITESNTTRKILESVINDNSRLIDNKQIGRAVENGYTAYKFPLYADAIQIADSEISKIYQDNRNIEDTLRVVQQRVSNYIK